MLLAASAFVDPGFAKAEAVELVMCVCVRYIVLCVCEREYCMYELLLLRNNSNRRCSVCLVAVCVYNACCCC